MGRMATYSGQLVTWDDAIHSELHLAPDRYAMDARPPTIARCRRELSLGDTRHNTGLVRDPI